MTAVPLSETASVTLGSSGGGTVKLGPKGRAVTWEPATASVVCSSATAEATCRLYVGSDTTARNFRDGTFTGSSGDSSDRVAGTIYQNSYVWAVWTGGDPGAQATLTLAGTASIP